MTTTTQPGLAHHNLDARNYHAPPTGGDVAAFHATLDGYTPTRLVDAPALADELGVARVLVKDESNRLGLPAFKILGASWASCHAVSDRLGLNYRTATVPRLRNALHESALTLVTATDGNHGRAVAVMARLLGVQARIYTPSGLTLAALAAIRSEGAELLELDRDHYDDVVTFAAHSVVGTPSHNAWPYLAFGLDLAVTVTDEHVIAAVHRLTTAGIDAGPCGAATWAAARTLQDEPVAGLNGDSVVVLISTEGQQANPLGDRK